MDKTLLYAYLEALERARVRQPQSRLAYLILNGQDCPKAVTWLQLPLSLSLLSPAFSLSPLSQFLSLAPFPLFLSYPSPALSLSPLSRFLSLVPAPLSLSFSACPFPLAPCFKSAGHRDNSRDWGRLTEKVEPLLS